MNGVIVAFVLAALVVSGFVGFALGVDTKRFEFNEMRQKYNQLNKTNAVCMAILVDAEKCPGLQAPKSSVINSTQKRVNITVSECSQRADSELVDGPHCDQYILNKDGIYEKIDVRCPSICKNITKEVDSWRIVEQAKS